MANPTYIIIIGTFVLYYLVILIFEKRMIQDPKDILDKFLSVVLLYAGISLIYFALTGNPFLYDSPESYSIYIFIMGFISILWTIPNLLKEFVFFQKFMSLSKRPVIINRKKIVKTTQKFTKQ